MPTTALNLQSFYPADLKIIGVKETAQEVVIQMHSISQECTCYKCGASLINITDPIIEMFRICQFLVNELNWMFRYLTMSAAILIVHQMP